VSEVSEMSKEPKREKAPGPADPGRLEGWPPPLAPADLQALAPTPATLEALVPTRATLEALRITPADFGALAFDALPAPTPPLNL